MPQCPVCHGSVKDDFGLQECLSCGAQLLVHMDGRVEYKGVDQVEPIEESPVEENVESEAYNELAESEFDDHHAPPDLDPSSQDEILSESPQENTTFNFDTPPDGPESEATPPPPAYVSAANPDSPDLSDVAAFGNSEMSGGRDGTLRYNLIIEGIDTADVREAFREAITDRKFVWDIDQILRSVRNGKVQIQNVAPTKGFMLVTRLRGLPLKIRWEQYAIQQT